MSEPSEPPFASAISAESLPPTEPQKGPCGWTLLSWLIILIVAGVFIAVQNQAKIVKAAAGDPANFVLLELQMRIHVGIKAATEVKPEDLATTIKVVENLNTGRVSQRLRAITGLGELAGPKRAVDELTALEALVDETGHEAPAEDLRRLEVLKRLYTDYANGRPNAPTVTPDERLDIDRSMGWFGDLALNPDTRPGETRTRTMDAAKRTFLTVVVAGVVVVVVFTLGFVFLFIMAVAWLRGAKISRLGPPVPHQGIYAETFAVWFSLYLGLLLLGPFRWGDYRMPPIDWACVALAASILALAWPVIRGVPWGQVRRDIGWTLGEQPLLEPSLGFVCYLMSLPLIFVGIVASMVIGMLYRSAPMGPRDPFQSSPNIAHPMNEQIMNSSVSDWLPVILLTCVLAPIIEETFFRGVLYRHMRDASRGWKVGFLLSVTIVSLLFAVVHPQGIFAALLLASLAAGFALGREWRGTLIPSMIAHGLQNTVALVLSVLCLMR